MTPSKLSLGQSVKVIESHYKINADDTIYTIGSLDRISGDYSALLLKDNKCIGAIPQIKLEAVK